MNSQELIREILQSIQDFDVSDMPTIDLYMDQVTTYLNEKLKIAKRHEEDKLLTKTMINNYAKSHLLPPPEKKKYSKDHLLALLSIFFFKNVISINDVTTILTPLLDEYFQNEEKPLDQILENFIEYIKGSDMEKPILKECEDSISMIKDIETDNREQLQTLSLISILCYDMFVRKIIVEKLVDSLPKLEEKTPDSSEKKTNKDVKKKTEDKDSPKTTKKAVDKNKKKKSDEKDKKYEFNNKKVTTDNKNKKEKENRK